MSHASGSIEVSLVSIASQGSDSLVNSSDSVVLVDIELIISDELETLGLNPEVRKAESTSGSMSVVIPSGQVDCVGMI